MPTVPPNRYLSASHIALVLPGAIPNAEAKSNTYRPLPSVWEGEDAVLLEWMLSFYPRGKPERILDATVGGWRFWKNSSRPVMGIDLKLRNRPTVVADNASMPFRASSFDVIVVRSTKENGYSFSYTFPPFLEDAHEILKPEGVLFCKITDYVHDHRYQWAHVELIKAAEAVEFVACDCIIKVRKGPIVDPKWKTAHHSRRRHAYWLVFRKSRDCE